MSTFDHTQIEPKWQAHWEAEKTFKADLKPDQKKFYCLDMFPYPSGAGLHVGHPLGYTATDIICRKKRMEGFNVLHPIGWDAFGLPAENYAIKTGTHPSVSTQANIKTFKRQIQSLGFSYDWDREVDTTDAKYVKWTQWIFLQLYKKGLAYEKKMPMYWCPRCLVVAANEEVEQGIHERCGCAVERRNMRQWMFRITDYAERLLNDLDTLDGWPEQIKAQQRNWIGRSEGLQLTFTVQDMGQSFDIYTTRPDTLYGATYMVLSPEHPLVDEITSDKHRAEVEAYRKEIGSKSDLQRTELNKDKTGVFTGAYAINPVNNEPLPIWIADYVLMTYGTGAIMAVPAHDARDHEFAEKFNLKIKQVITAPEGNDDAIYTGKDGVSVNSGLLDGLTCEAAFTRICDWAEAQKVGERKVNYRLRDWVFSRNRYWGEPIPLIHAEDGTVIPLEESELPLTLPEVDDYKPLDGGGSPLDKATDWVNDPRGKRETLTMPNWAGSSWYWLRYMDPENEDAFCSPEAEKYWGAVDLYVGGAEHAVLHLLYARFWHKVLFDLGVVSTIEPFSSLKNQGLILAEDGNKMSKSLGNVVNPDEIVASHGADTLRVYEMFMGPFDQPKQWSSGSVGGCRKFLDRVWRLGQKLMTEDDLPREVESLLHETIQIVTEHINEFRFNTAVSQLMILTNALTPMKEVPAKAYHTLVRLMAPFAPHLAEELWSTVLGEDSTLSFAPWPQADATKIVKDTITYAVQVNGKVRAQFDVAADAQSREIILTAKEIPAVKKYIEAGELVREIYVPGRLIGFVVK